MFYYKNKIKVFTIMCAIILIFTVAVSFTVCMWDDTSIKSLFADSTTADFVGEVPPLFPGMTINLGNIMMIDNVIYTVGHIVSSGSNKYVTLLSEDISTYGKNKVDSKFHITGNINDSIYENSTIKENLATYYNTIKTMTISLMNSSGTIAISTSTTIVGDNIIKHLDNENTGYGELWLPSRREMSLTAAQGSYPAAIGEIEGVNQPVMSYYTNLNNRITTKWYWLRSPMWNTNNVYIVANGVLGNSGVNNTNNSGTTGAVRAALNLKI